MKTLKQNRGILLGIGVVGVALICMSLFVYGGGSELAQPAPASSSSVAVVSPTSSQPTACDSDGKVCPDGSVVGRVGPKCEFAACPSPDATSATLTTYLGGRVTGLNLTVNPREIISDSRCPRNVQCIQAGTVEVRTAVETQVGHGEHVFKLNEGRTVGNFLVTLIGVTPTPSAGEEIPVSSYRFTFEIKRK